MRHHEVLSFSLILELCFLFFLQNLFFWSKISSGETSIRPLHFRAYRISDLWKFFAVACCFLNRNIRFCLPVPKLIYLWEIYIFPGLVCLFFCSEICGLILGIYKSLTDTWMWKLGLRPRNSQKRNTYMGFSLQCSFLMYGTCLAVEDDLKGRGVVE